jgi:hypothetical protein
MKHSRITALLPVLLLAAGLFVAPPAASALERLRTTPGTWYLGGQVTFEHEASSAKGLDTGPSVQTWSLEPAVGWFIHRKVALEAALQWERREVGKEEDTASSVILGARFVSTRGPHLYLGTHLVGRRLEGAVGVQQWGARLSLGVLIALHRRLALDLGLRLTLMAGDLEFDGDEQPYATSRFTFGFFGLVGTF